MSSRLKKFGVAALAALSIATASVATSSSANAQRFHHGWHGGWHHRGFGFAPVFAGALAFGAFAGGPYYYGGPAYYGDCFPRRRVVGFTPWGRPIVRFVRACY
jgi:hypothetical protein